MDVIILKLPTYRIPVIVVVIVHQSEIVGIDLEFGGRNYPVGSCVGSIGRIDFRWIGR